ncbi:MAG TPA: SET domain-containing protein [Candidatus Paceibacterota bacterium]|nr:SET domain-containing protein [Candidatus Paceibacterota bacterium]
MILIKSYLKKSGIHGIGLFAKENIPKGKKVWEFTIGFDLSMSKDEVDSLSDAAKEQFLNYAYISKDTGKYILCSDDSRFFNHSNTPNVICAYTSLDKIEKLECFAGADISFDQELTCNYREFDSNPSDVI